MRKLSPGQERYMNDQKFHACVESMRSWLHTGLIDINSLMYAAVEAANMHAQYTAAPMVIRIEERSK